MKLFLHFLKYNLIFNRAGLLLLSGIAMVIIGISHVTCDDGISAGHAIMQYCSYIFFIKITGKLNHKTSHSFDTKHMAALPCTKLLSEEMKQHTTCKQRTFLNGLPRR